jgi:hypothetical protein
MVPTLPNFRRVPCTEFVQRPFPGQRYGCQMSSVHVDPSALHAAAGNIDGVAASFTGTSAPAVPMKVAQSTTATVNAALVATATAEKTIATRLRSTASAMSSGGIAFATTEHASTAAVAAVPDSR